MVLTTALITGGVVATGSQVYLQTKRKKKGYWASYADKIEAKTKPRRSLFPTGAVNASILTPFFSSGLFKLLPRIGTPDSKLEAGMTAGAENADIDQAVKSADQHFAVSVASLGLAATGTMLFPPLRLLGWMGYFYASAGFYKGAYHSIVHERKLKMVVVDAVMFTGILATGSLVAGTLMCSLIWLAEKLFAPRLRGD